MRINIRPAALPAVTGLAIAISGRNVKLTWDYFNYAVNIYASASNNRANAIKAGSAAAGTQEYTDILYDAFLVYYWVVATDSLNRETGVWRPLSATDGISLPIIELPAVTGLAVTSGLRANQLSWDGPFDYPVAIYGSITDSFVTATKVGVSSAGSSGYTHVTGVPTTWYYWVRALDWLNREAGIWNPPSTGGGLVAASQLAIDLDIAAGAVKASNLAVAAISSTTGELNSNTVSALNIAAGAVTASKTAIAAISPSTGNLTANSVTAANIVAGTITSSNIAAGTITANNILGSTITGNKIAAGTITAGNIQAYSITADRIQSDSITAAQISAGYVYAGTIAANKISAGTLTAMIIKGSYGEFTSPSTNAVFGGYSVSCSGYYGQVGVFGSGTLWGVYGQSGGAGCVALRGDNIHGGVGLSVTGSMAISSSTMVTNLNAQYLGNYPAASFRKTSDAVDAASLGGSTLASVRSGIDAVTLGGINTNQYCWAVSTSAGTAWVSNRGLSIYFDGTLSGSYRTYASGSNIVFGTVSDENLKKDIEPEVLGLEFLNAVKPVTFRMRADDALVHHGFIAQDMGKMFSDVNQDCLYTEAEDGVKGVNYSALISPLVKAIQELSAKVAELEFKLESKNG